MRPVITHRPRLAAPAQGLLLGLALFFTPFLSAQEPGERLVVLSGSDCVDGFDLGLAPSPQGFTAVWTSLETRLQQLAADGTRRSELQTVEPVSDGRAFWTKIATNPDGSGAVAWVDSRSREVWADFFDVSGRLDGDPLLLGTIPSAALDDPLVLSSLDDGTFLLADDLTPTAVRFGPDRVVRPVPLQRVYLDHDILRVGDELWHAGVRFEGGPDAEGIAVLELRRRNLDGGPLGPPLLIRNAPATDFFNFSPGVSLARDELGGLHLAWAPESGVELFRFDASGDLLSTLDVSGDTPVARFADVDLVTDAEGNRLVVWEALPGPDDPGFGSGFSLSLVRASAVLADDTPVTRGAILANPAEDVQEGRLGAELVNPQVVFTGGGQATVGFEGFTENPFLPPLCGFKHTSLLLPGVPVGGERWLLLREGRFRVEVDWQDPFNGGTGIGHAVPGTEDAGSFWFFDEDTKEIEVKVLDGRDINGHFWVFAAGLSNVGYQVTVTDQRTGLSRTYDNPPRDFGNFIDTTAFAADGPTELVPPAGARRPIRLSTEFSCDPRDPVLEPFADGFVAAWGHSGELFTREFNEDGAPVDLEPSLHVYSHPSITIDGPVEEATVAVAPDGTRLWAGLWDGEVSARLFAGVTDGDRRTYEGLFAVAGDEVELEAATLGDGGFVVADVVSGQAARVLFDGGVTPFRLPVTGRSPALLGVGDELWHVFVEGAPGPPVESRVTLQRLTALGDPLADPVSIAPPRRAARGLTLTRNDRDDRGRVYAAWVDEIGVRLQLLDFDGVPQREEPLVLAPLPGRDFQPIRHLDLASDAEGNVLVAWEEIRRDESHSRIQSVNLLASGPVARRLNPPLRTPEGSGEILSDPAVVLTGGGNALIAARLYEPGASTPLQCSVPATLVGRRVALGADRSLLLRDGRFQVFVDWEDPFNDNQGFGRPVPGTEDAGSFWFFSPDTKEIEVKVLDGRTINGNFWVFAAGLSNVGYRIVVFDQRTGRTRIYNNPPREFGNFIDTTSFPGG